MTAADRRANALLASFLQPSEFAQWTSTGAFWVHTDHGWFRFGTLYDIRYRSPRWPWVERSICVVTEGFEDRPLADLWAELVVVARADAGSLAGTANFRGEAAARLQGSNDPVLLRRSIDAAKARYRSLRQAGHDLDAAYLAFDTAQRLRRSCRPRWAGAFAAGADQLIRGFADRHPQERSRILDAHRVVFAELSLPRSGVSS